jgi:hypothetical protein
VIKNAIKWMLSCISYDHVSMKLPFEKDERGTKEEVVVVLMKEEDRR